MLTLEFIEGVKSTDTRDMDAAGLDRQELARNLVRGAVQMVMIDGFFHADPHPGNVVVELASGRLTFLDAGMVGQLDLRKRIRFARFLLAFRDKDVAELATYASLAQRAVPRAGRRAPIQREFEQRIGPLIDQPAGRTAPLQKLVSEALDVLRDAGYRLDPQLTLAAKAVAQAEAITSALVPEAGASDFAQLGGAALEELVPEAVNSDAILGAARKQAIFAVGEVAERLPSLRGSRRSVGRPAREGRDPRRRPLHRSRPLLDALRVRRAADRRRDPAHRPADRLGDRRHDRRRSERFRTDVRRRRPRRVRRHRGGRGRVDRRAALAAAAHRRPKQPNLEDGLAEVGRIIKALTEEAWDLASPCSAGLAKRRGSYLLGGSAGKRPPSSRRNRPLV